VNFRWTMKPLIMLTRIYQSHVRSICILLTLPLIFILLSSLGSTDLTVVLSSTSNVNVQSSERKNDVGGNLPQAQPLLNKNEMSNLDGDAELERFISENIRHKDGSQRQVILLSYQRSGSTFTGEVLGQYPGAFFIHEPLWSLCDYMIFKLDDPEWIEDGKSILQNFLDCNYDVMRTIIGVEGNKNWKPWFLKHNEYFKGLNKWKLMRIPDSKISQTCASAPLQVIKVLRMRLGDMRTVMDRNPKLQIVHLVRDPRATYNSRRVFPYCVFSTNCWKPESICRDMGLDAELSTQFKKDYPNRYIILRHEDLSRDPYGQTRSLLRFLGLELHSSVLKYLQEHTRAAVKDVNMHTRDSNITTVEWMGKLGWEKTEEVQEICRKAIDLLGYDFYENEEQFVETMERFGIAGKKVSSGGRERDLTKNVYFQIYGKSKLEKQYLETPEEYRYNIDNKLRGFPICDRSRLIERESEKD